MLIVAAFATVLSAIVSWMAYRVLQNRLGPNANRTVPILVAGEQLSIGTRLMPRQVRLATWSKAMPLQGSFSDPKEIIGRGVVVPMVPNEPVLEAKLAPKEGGAGLTSAIPEGMRAMAVKVNDVIGVAGFVLPGTHVDVILTGSAWAGSHENTAARVILENIQVLAVGQNLRQDVDGKPQNAQVITLLVTPEDAQKLSLASMEGRIQLALRNPMDLKSARPAAVHKAALFGKSLWQSDESTRFTPVEREAAPRVQHTVLHGSESKSPARATHVAARAAAAVQKVVSVELIQGNTRQMMTFEKVQ
jgi:pilus assembly protein CpaB